ncbi:nucleoside hydrolase [Romboutsia lituseburensis]|uniref:Purine nucleosidase n=1 Tax=Romboutsia lituseburensis DSM 797 TaxID=1121325 RepID=A0A1G9MAY1_9FIRM|nr:nucleoside hydrolase [Romboutsia lituseburensis]CEH34537.1 Pyrimidine-specific ribonucleoside hydrolase RihA [Romboutsia lituseburensis]SDL71369.1 purine nucleosidase [Romboutsia lituseburensis DSM 797]
MQKRKVIIDCDPGIDDSLALLLALNSPELEVLGITVCSGNVPAKLGAKNALKTLQICSSLHIPVYVGEEYPLKRELVTAQDTHGDDGLGENFYEDVNEAKFYEGGVDFIIDTLNNNDNVSIIALGPLTNIAKALMKDKKAFNNLDEFVSMGGAFRIHGNCSPVAEFNYWVDPHGADYVYKNLPKKIHMVGLDVTRKIVLTPNIIEFINRLDKDMSKYITEITRFYIDFHWDQEKIIGCVINDPLAVAYFIDRNICKGFESFVEVVEDGIAMGQSIVDSFNFYKKENNAIVLTDVDKNKFMSMFLKRMFNGYDDIIDSIEGVI